LAPQRAETYAQAGTLILELIRSPRFPEFLTLPAYDRIMATEGAAA
jgi:hypothetical protein